MKLLEQFFLHAHENRLLYTGHYDRVLVMLSVLSAVFSSYAALLVARRALLAASRREHRLWVVTGGLVMGGGTWSMHFVAMLAFDLPCGTRYDLGLTLLSMWPGILASMRAIALISRPVQSRRGLLLAGLILGSGIGTMHYVGMAAYRIDGYIRYQPGLFVLSILVAIALATLALWVKFRLEPAPVSGRVKQRALILGALVLGGSVSAMHYTAMAAANFVQGPAQNGAYATLSPQYLASIVLSLAVTLMIITSMAAQIDPGAAHGLHSNRWLILLSMLGWTLLAWFATDQYCADLQQQLLATTRAETQHQLRRLDTSLGDRLNTVRGITRLLASTDPLRNLLGRSKTPPTASTAGLRREHWSGSPEHLASGRYLAAMSGSLDIEAIWIINADGHVIASSKASQVGDDVNVLDYFRQARSGMAGQQYATDRNSQESALYYVQPVFYKRQFLGAVAARYPIREFRSRIEGSDALISDSRGVIVLADQERLEFRRSESVTAQLMPTVALEHSYGRELMVPLIAHPWQDGRFADVVTFGRDATPFLVAHQPHPDHGVLLHIHRPLPELARLAAQRTAFFVVMSLCGILLILSASLLTLYHKSRRRELQLQERRRLEVAAALDESRQANRQLAQREALLQTILDSAGSAIYLTGPDTRIRMANPRTSELFQYSPTELTGLHYVDLVAPEEREDVKRKTPDLLSGAVPSLSHVRRYRRRDGSLFWGHVTGRPYRDAEGRLLGIVGVLDDVTVQHESEERMQYLALHDYLTGLPNRAWLLENANLALQLARRHGRQFALMFVDLDRFKLVNDIHGHDAGDLVLKTVAERLRAAVRESDAVCRQGGDEFVVLLPEISDASILPVIAAKVRSSVDRPIAFHGVQLSISASVGIASYPVDGSDLDTLLLRADAAMYQDKVSRQQAR